MKYSNTAITQLNRWYKQILIKCAIFNAAVIAGGVMIATPAMADEYTPVEGRVTITQDETFNNNSFTGFSASSMGGAINNNAGYKVDITNSLFENNQAINPGHPYGGAIYNKGTMTISGTKFINNSAHADNDSAVYGGAIENAAGSITIDNSEFIGNSAYGSNSGVRGGAILNASGTVSVSNSVFKKNSVSNEGNPANAMSSAIQSNGGTTLNLINNTFGGDTKEDGNVGASSTVVSNHAVVNLEGNTFKNNTSSKEGILNFQGANAQGTFTGTNIFDSNNGNALYVSGGTNGVTFKSGSNTTFSSNDATWNKDDVSWSTPNGGAIYNTDTITFEAGSTANFTGNKAVSGGAIYNKAGGTMNLNGGATFADNNDVNGANDIYNAGTLNFGNGAGDEISLAGGINGSEGVINKTGDGTLVIANALTNQTVAVNAGELVLDNVNLTGSTVSMQSGSTLNTMDDVINAYSSVALQTGSMFKADFIGTQSDTYSAVSGASVKLSGFNYSGDLTVGQSQDYVVADGAYIGTEGKLSQYSGGYKFTAAGNSEGSGKVTITNAGQSLINDAVKDTEEGTKTTINYDMSTSEEYYSASGDNAKIQDSNFTIEGGTDESGNPIALTAVSGATGIEIENSNVTINNLTFKNFDTDYALKNNAGSTLTIKDSHFDSSNAVAIENAGTLYSDPTIYEAKVINSGSATFEDDSFKNIATTALTNSGTVNLVATSEDIEFVDNGLDVAQTNGTLNLYADNGNTITFNNGITGTGTSSINLMNGETIFNADVTGNAINLNNDSALYLGDNVSIDGANISNDANGGLIDLRNNRIDALGNVTLGSDMSVLIDANLNTHEADSVGSNTISGTGNMVVDAIELLALSGNATETVNLATASNAGKVTVTEDAKSTLKTYYKSVVYDNTTGVLTMSTPEEYAKLELVGSWGTGNYIKAFTTADAANTSVGANLGYLDTQVKVNEDNISDVQTVLGSAQTTAATTGLLSGVTIGADADVVTALDTVAQTAAGTALDNTFTGQNTFANANGITIANGTDPSAADYAKTNLKATSDGLTIDTGLSVDGALTTTGAATIGNKLTVKAGGADITGNTTIKGNTTTTGGLYAAEDNNGDFQFQVGSTGNVYVGVNKFTVNASNGNVTTKGDLTVGGLTTFSDKGFALDGATITGITTSTEMAALLADPTTASDANLVTERALVSGISTVIAQKEQWAQGLLGVDTTQGTNNQLQNALNTLGTTDGKGNNISATTVASALHELDVEKSGLAQDNVFTGQNTFANANGITIANGTDPAAADYAKTNLRATADGLAIDTGLTVDGALTTTGAATIGDKLTVQAGGADITGNTSITGTLTTTGSATIGKKLSVAGGLFKVTSSGGIVVGDADQNFVVEGDGDVRTKGALNVGGKTTLSATNGMQFGDGQNVNAIDATEAGLTDKSATTLATVTTVLSSAQNADFTPAATSLAETRIGAAINELNGNMHDVLGDMYSTVDGSYDLSALNGNGFVTAGTVDNLTKDLNAYASNIATAFGGSFDDTTGVWSSGVTAKTSANYTGSVASTTVAGAMDTLAQVTYNIGTATNATYGNIASDNTVNANLDALDAAIGDRSFATTTYVAPNDNLSTAVTKLDKELHTVNHDVRKLRHDMDRGLASVAALSALVPNARGTGNTSLSVGTGYYNGHSAFALGGAHWFTDNLMVNIGAAASMGHTRDMTYRAGVSYSF